VRQGRVIDVVVSRGVPRVKVPKVVGMPREEARALLEASSLRLGTVSRRTATGAPDRVLEQRPKPGEEVRVDPRST
jgi:serine/threonine-protein kinase